MRGKDGLTANRTEQSKIVKEYFKKTFCKNKQPIRAIPPTQITTLFIADEIRKVIVKIKRSKSPGCNEILAELMKYAPEPYMNKSQKYTTLRQRKVIHQEK